MSLLNEMLEQYLEGTPGVTLPLISKESGLKQIQLARYYKDLYGSVEWRRRVDDRNNKLARQKKNDKH